MAGSRRQRIPVEDSWRMIEGSENDSFDTSIVRGDEDDDLILSSGSDPSQQPSQLSHISGSQPFSIGGSQDDNIENFLIRAGREDDRALLRTPFEPSVPRAVRERSRETMQHRAPPEPEFYMPTVQMENPRGMSTRSSMTVRGGTGFGLRQRQPPTAANTPRKGRSRGKATTDNGFQETQRSVGDRMLDSIPGGLYDILAWVLGLVGLGFRYAQKPLALALALYVTFGVLVVVQNMATKSIYASLSPVCRIPGVSRLDLPFCPAIIPRDGGGGGEDEGKSASQPIEFDGLVDVQEQFEQVLEKSAQGVSLPMEMKRSEASIRDLRTMVRYSELQSRDELVLEFDGFIETARAASNDLQKFNTHVGSAVDAVISINRWTSRYLDGLAAEHEAGDGSALVTRWLGWAFAPFQPAVFSERALLDQYVEHAALVAERIAQLIVEAQAVLRQLERAEDHLGIIYELATRTQRAVQGRRNDVLWTLWTFLGGNGRRLHSLDSQLALLRRVDGQRLDAVRQVSELVVELERIQAGLSDLRDRVAEPGIARGATARVEIPLSVHIETINRGVERLEVARSRIRAVENERIREVLARGAGGEERLIDAT